MSHHSMLKYACNLTKRVERKITRQIPSLFSIFFIEELSDLMFAEWAVKKLNINHFQDLYIYLSLFLPKSNVCQEIFSKAGYALSDCRKKLTPEHFEQQIFCMLMQSCGISQTFMLWLIAILPRHTFLASAVVEYIKELSQ